MGAATLALEKLESLSRWFFPWAAGTLEIKREVQFKKMSRFSKAFFRHFHWSKWLIQEGWCLKRSSIIVKLSISWDRIMLSVALIWSQKSILASRATKSNSSSVAMDLPQLGSQAEDEGCELFLSCMKRNHQVTGAMTVFPRLRGGSRRTTRVWGCLVWSGEWLMWFSKAPIQFTKACYAKTLVFDPSEDCATVGSPSALATVWGLNNKHFLNLKFNSVSWGDSVYPRLSNVNILLQSSPKKPRPEDVAEGLHEVPYVSIFVGERCGRTRLWWGGIFFPGSLSIVINCIKRTSS